MSYIHEKLELAIKNKAGINEFIKEKNKMKTR